MKLIFNKLKIMQLIMDNCDICPHCQNHRYCPLILNLRKDLLVLRFGKINITKCELFKQEA